MTATEEPPVEEKVLQFPKQYENMGAQGIPGGQEAFLRKAPAKPKTGVMIATTKRHWPNPAEWAAMSKSGELAKFLEREVPQIGRALRELAGHPDYAFEFAVAVGGHCRAKNTLVHDFLNKTNHTWLLWWDDDLYPEGMTGAEAVLRLLSHRQPYVGAPYCKRAKKPMWAATFMPKAVEEHGVQFDLLQMAELAGGFTLVHRKCYTELRRIFAEQVSAEAANSIEYRDRDTGEKMHAFYQQMVVGKDLLSEDYFMQYLMRCAKIGILMDTKLRCKHRDADGTFYPIEFPAIPGVDE
jgi:hypothetical protein